MNSTCCINGYLLHFVEHLIYNPIITKDYYKEIGAIDMRSIVA